MTQMLLRCIGMFASAVVFFKNYGDLMAV